MRTVVRSAKANVAGRRNRPFDRCGKRRQDEYSTSRGQGHIKVSHKAS